LGSLPYSTRFASIGPAARFKISTSFAQSAIFPAKLAQLPLAALVRPPSTRVRVPLSLLRSLPHRRLGQVEVADDLAHRAVPSLAQLVDLGLELRGE
jgi:hypothetical protein